MSAPPMRRSGASQINATVTKMAQAGNAIQAPNTTFLLLSRDFSIRTIA